MWETIGGLSQPFMGVLSSAMGPLKPRHTPTVYPSGTQAKQAPTPEVELNKVIKNLDSHKKAWANLPAAERATLFRQCITTALDATEDAARLMADAKGQYGNGLGEERTLLITPLVALREYAEALEAGGQPQPKKVYQRPDGQHVAEVLPKGLEALFFGGYKGEVWMEPGQPASQGKVYRDQAAGKKSEGAVALVLGAGNQISVLLMDIMHMLVVENAVVVCKSNPVLDYLGPYIEKSLAPLVQAGYVAFVYGGAKEGAYLCKHELVEALHLTGSAATYDAIVWGSDKAKAGKPALQKQVTAELGCVTPYIIVPGNWSKKAIAYWADECVAGLVNNSGHNCTKLEVLITAADWPQREAFVQAVRERLDSIPQRVPWYPGSDKRYSDFKAKFGGAEELGQAQQPAPASCKPWLFKAGLTPEQADTQTENWCGVLQEVGLPGEASDASKFLEAAVNYANDRCWGSLSCTVVSPPETDAAALDKAVAGLRYGAVGVNIPSFVVYSFPKLSWGAYPGNSPKDIGSGIGSVHNTMLFDHVQKSVLYSSWIHHPTHLWSPSVKNLDSTTWHAARFLANPGMMGLSSTAVCALRG